MRLLALLLTIAVIAGCSQSMYSQGRKLSDEGKYDKAISLFYEEIKLKPDSYEAWRELGVAYYEQNNMEKAEDALMQANSIKPTARTNLYLGLIHEKNENYKKAIDAYRAALALNPKSDTKNMIRARLDLLISHQVKSEVNFALKNESEIKVDSIPPNTVAVVDFDDSHLDPDVKPISKGLAELTALDLAKVKSLRVVDRLKMDVIQRELDLSRSKYSDPSTSPRLGRLVGSRTIVTGSVFGLGDQTIRLDGAVVDTRDSSATATPATEGNLEQFFKVQKDFVFSVIDKMGIKLSAEERNAIEKIPTESYLAFLAYSRGLEKESIGDYNGAGQEFDRATKMDASFAPAQAAKSFASGMAAVSGESVGDKQAFSRFESAVSSSTATEIMNQAIASFQAGSLDLGGFIRTFGLGGNDQVFSPPRTGAVTGTVIVTGRFDVQF